MILENQRYYKVIIDLISNYLSIILLFIFFSWDKIFYIIKGKSNKVDSYFKFPGNDIGYDKKKKKSSSILK